MRSYDEAWEAATDRRPFSNGTEGYAWMDNWCDRCIHDRPMRADVPSDPRNNGLVGCALVAVALNQRTPAEWIDQTENGHRLGDTYHCTEFRDEDDGDDESEPDPGPLPVIEGQTDMFGLFADQIADEVAALSRVER